MKYYINREKNIILTDENENTPYLAEKGYEEITKEEYDVKNQELVERIQSTLPNIINRRK